MNSSMSVMFKLFTLLVIIAAATGKLEEEEEELKDPIEKALQSLSSEEKNDFLTYFLALGLKDWAEKQPRPPKFLIHKPTAFIKGLNISQETIDKFEELKIPKESREKLFQWTKSEFNLSTMNVLELIRTKKCSKTVCLPDIGEMCCPW